MVWLISIDSKIRLIVKMPIAVQPELPPKSSRLLRFKISSRGNWPLEMVRLGCRHFHKDTTSLRVLTNMADLKFVQAKRVRERCLYFAKAVRSGREDLPEAVFSMHGLSSLCMLGELLIIVEDNGLLFQKFELGHLVVWNDLAVD